MNEPAQPVLDRRRFTRLWQRLGARGDGAEAFDRIAAGYAEAWRRYHGTAHLLACLVQFDRVRQLARRPDEVEIALWYHDAVYRPQAPVGVNELESARLAGEALAAARVDGAVGDRVAALVMATTHRDIPADNDAALITDIDLAILAAPAAEFARFEEAIRAEYAHVADADFRLGRMAVLRHFLERETIYHTAHYRATAEAAARANLTGRVAQLSS